MSSTGIAAVHAWLTRSGRYGERDDWALANGVTPGGFDRVPDLIRRAHP